jgi:putative ABC transport system substrate-binding protein
MKDGAVLALARDYYQAGLEAAEIGVRVLRGADPASIPFTNTRSERLLVNPEAAARFGLTIPEGVLRQAEVFTPAKKP